MRGFARFVGEFVLAMLALGAGIGCLWIIDKLGPPVLMFLVRVGL